LNKMPDGNHLRWRQYSVFPNLGMDYYPEMFDFFQILPIGPEKTRIRAGVYGHPDTRDGVARLRELNIHLGTVTNDEDKELCDRVQAGLKIPGYQPGPLSSEEISIKQFHQMIRNIIPQACYTEKPVDL
ncbi:MAG: RHO alpha subunit C-terminal catalytic domain-containing protein, partial [Alphaproteobacteria bacterium]|nr:RHO alpha subunit C-terminal catalytic domain-containing protein [Alphaproteobacteria bacterium]